jgi:hypothetical protein
MREHPTHKKPRTKPGVVFQRTQLLLLSALLATLSRLAGLLRRLLGLLTGLRLPTATLLTTALLVLLVVLILIVLVHSILQISCELLFEYHHSTNSL